jgi:hypothetical protein
LNLFCRFNGQKQLSQLHYRHQVTRAATLRELSLPTGLQLNATTQGKPMIGSLMMCVGSLLLLIGMLAGITMGIQQDFTLAPAHAHLNLVGGVLLFMFGLYYRLVPAAGSTSLAKLQGWLHIAGAILFPAGIALVVLKGTSFIAAPIIGSLIVVAAMALFALIVFRSAQA